MLWLYVMLWLYAVVLYVGARGPLSVVACTNVLVQYQLLVPNVQSTTIRLGRTSSSKYLVLTVVSSTNVGTINLRLTQIAVLFQLERLGTNVTGTN